MVRLLLAVIVGIILSFVSVALFTAWESLKEVTGSANIFSAIAKLLGTNFSFDIISFFGGNMNIIGFLAPPLLAWIFVGYISGTIARGPKNGAIAGLLVFIVILLTWIITTLIAGEIFLELFQGTHLIATLGGILSGIIGAILGSVLGGLVSGREEFLI
ncbi:MAG: hypothetical protein ACFFAN_10485 [Promethearchaeota archaeon]